MSILPSIPAQLIPIIQSIWTVWAAVWWIVTPIIAAIVAWEAWLLHLHHRFITSINWKLLEIKIPKNILKTPKAMEQIFAAAHAPYSYGIRLYDKYWKGQEEFWFSFEMVGRAGGTHFYLRVPSQFRNMMESAVYGQYPEAEITEAEDYLEEMPHIIPNDEFDVAGFEEILRHPNYLPIRTYPMFEEAVEEHRIDTIAGLMEIMSKLREDEQMWLQLIIKPTGEAFKEEGEKAIRKILNIEEKSEKKGSLLPKLDLGFGLSDILRAPFSPPGDRAHKEEKTEKMQRFIISPGDKEITEGISEKIAKLAFEATVRYLIIEKKQRTSDPGYTMALHGYMRQYNTQHLNSLKPDSATTTASYAVRGFFKQARLRWRKRLLFEHYRHILPAHHESILNIEELATIFHFPLGVVSTTELEKVESRKGSPPAGLPVIEE